MPKQKSKRALRKRVKLTGRGRLRRYHAYKSHILTKKASKRRRQLDVDAILKPCEAKVVKKMLPYGRP